MPARPVDESGWPESTDIALRRSLSLETLLRTVSSQSSPSLWPILIAPRLRSTSSLCGTTRDGGGWLSWGLERSTSYATATL